MRGKAEKLWTGQTGRFCSSLGMVVGVCSTFGPSGCLQNWVLLQRVLGNQKCTKQTGSLGTDGYGGLLICVAGRH